MNREKALEILERNRAYDEWGAHCAYAEKRVGEGRNMAERAEALSYAIEAIKNEPHKIDGNTSDGYHTFNELYHHRAVLFSVIVEAFSDKAWKSKRHHDGTMYDGMFIVGIETPDGQATYHYDIEPYWNMFDCKELSQAPEWDGHTPSQAIERIGKLEPECPDSCSYKRLDELFQESQQLGLPLWSEQAWDKLQAIVALKKGNGNNG